MPELQVTAAISDPGEAIAPTVGLAVPLPNIVVSENQTSVVWPSDVYIHDGVKLEDTEVTAENNDELQTYPAFPGDLGVAPPVRPSLGDGLYVCHTAKFDCIQFFTDTVGVGDYLVRMSYFDGMNWVAIPSFYGSGNDTNHFKSSGYRWVSFNRPSDWGTFLVDGKFRYIVHAEIYQVSSGDTGISVIPRLKSAVLGIWA
jgi:hypothetical protein